MWFFSSCIATYSTTLMDDRRLQLTSGSLFLEITVISTVTVVHSLKQQEMEKGL